MTNTAQPNAPASAGRHTSDPRFPAQITKALERRPFATLATASPAQRRHVVAVLDPAVGQALYVTVPRDSGQARSPADNRGGAVCVPVRRLPIGPAAPSQFQGTAELLTKDD